MIASYCFNLGENKICKLKDQISVINFTRVITGYDAVVQKFNQNRTVTPNKRLYILHPKMSAFQPLHSPEQCLVESVELHVGVFHSDKEEEQFFFWCTCNIFIKTNFYNA